MFTYRVTVNASPPTEPAIVEPRRSTRPTRKPNWMGTGEFAMAITSEIPDWQKRVDCLKSLLLTAPESVHADIFKAIVLVISSQT